MEESFVDRLFGSPEVEDTPDTQRLRDERLLSHNRVSEGNPKIHHGECDPQLRVYLPAEARI